MVVVVVMMKVYCLQAASPKREDNPHEDDLLDETYSNCVG